MIAPLCGQGDGIHTQLEELCQQLLQLKKKLTWDSVKYCCHRTLDRKYVYSHLCQSGAVSNIESKGINGMAKTIEPANKPRTSLLNGSVLESEDIRKYVGRSAHCCLWSWGCSSMLQPQTGLANLTYCHKHIH